MLIRRSVRRALWATAAMFLAAAAGLSSAATAAAAPGLAPVLQEVSGSGTNSFTRSFTNSGTPLLARFQYDFTNGDHRLRRIAGMPLPAQSAEEITYADRNGDDPFNFRISHEMVDPTGIITGSLHGSCAGQCTVNFTRPGGNYNFVLTGFRFSFDNDEHKLDKIGVSESGGRLTTVFEDQNGDDPYTFDVSYAFVLRTRLGVVADVTNVVHQSGTASVAVSSGEKVIRGFFLDNLATGNASENNIRDLGVVANFSTIDLVYGDQNPQDSADWRYTVQYATLV